jgi:hypothetical protein
MSLIVSFPLHRVAPVAAQFSGAHEAEVVIFPGVRIERQDTAACAARSITHESRGAAAVAQDRDIR